MVGFCGQLSVNVLLLNHQALTMDHVVHAELVLVRTSSMCCEFVQIASCIMRQMLTWSDDEALCGSAASEYSKQACVFVPE